MAEGDAAEQTSEKSKRGGHCGLKKIKVNVEKLQEEIHNRCGNGGKVRLMFQDEAGFGRICLTICSLLPEIISRITGRAWILNALIGD